MQFSSDLNLNPKNITQILKQLILEKGSISLADFMQEALFNKMYGYYRVKNPIGKNADFTTAPEISQVFGELIAAYFLNLILHSTKKIAFVEMGAGRGTFFQDLIRTIEKLGKKLSYYKTLETQISFNIIEISESLTALQKETLKASPFQINWHQNFDDFLKNNKNCEIYFFANELFDCFPIHQFVRAGHGWSEILIAKQNNEFCFVVEKFNPLKSKMIENLFERDVEKIVEGMIFEYSFAATNFMNNLCKSIKENGGNAVIIDYGYYNLPQKSTLQAIKNHQYHNPLKNIGEADITALVDFYNLENCAKKHNLSTSLLTQRDFLLSLGIEERRRALQDDSAINRLIDKDKMGELFKSLIIWA